MLSQNAMSRANTQNFRHPNQKKVPTSSCTCPYPHVTYSYQNSRGRLTCIINALTVCVTYYKCTRVKGKIVFLLHMIKLECLSKNNWYPSKQENHN